MLTTHRMRSTNSAGLLVAVASLIVATSCVRPSTRASASRDDAAVATIRATIERGARGFMSGQPDTILSHYARDIVLSYPGIPDQDYATLEKVYGELRSRPADVRVTTAPTFDEVLVSGDLAVVRVRWTTTITRGDQTTTRRLKDMQIWRRESDGRWMFIRGMHYPDTSP